MRGWEWRRGRGMLCRCYCYRCCGCCRFEALKLYSIRVCSSYGMVRYVCTWLTPAVSPFSYFPSFFIFLSLMFINHPFLLICTLFLSLISFSHVFTSVSPIFIHVQVPISFPSLFCTLG
ncbi:hypothetical protein CPB84DRAFT_708443 [Gymnopilus junonius]|uniref:Uncharacterized protein n=1 Tax=Gymnopilus junonius TaxID=109634 RepID=A0A9P5N935_GYMJU|nr:hypothetical protein CPB84DRAFT_708443 [Gymnopilus junonius]